MLTDSKEQSRDHARIMQEMFNRALDTQRERIGYVSLSSGDGV